MIKKEIIERKAFLHNQAAALLKADAERHEADAKRLREEAVLLEESGDEQSNP